MARKTRMSKTEKLRRSIERWERKQEDAVVMLRKSAEMLTKLRRQNRRLLERETAEHHERRRELSRPPVAVDEGTVVAATESSRDDNDAGQQGEVKKADDGIPGFLRRGQAAQAAVDDAISEAARKLAAMPDPRSKEKKAERRAVEAEVRAADLTGKRRRVPPSGREALKAIRESR